MGHTRNEPPAERDLSGTRASKLDGAASRGRLSTMQRVNGAYCQSTSRAMRKARAVFVDTIPRKQHDRRSTRDGCGKMPVFGQQDPILFGAARGEGAVGKSACGKNGVVTGRTQPSAEAAQHLVAQKPWHLSRVPIHPGGELTRSPLSK